MHTRNFALLFAPMSGPFLHATTVYTDSDQWSQAIAVPYVTEYLGNNSFPNDLIANVQTCGFRDCAPIKPVDGVLTLTSEIPKYGSVVLNFAQPIYSIGFDMNMTGNAFGLFAA